MRDLGCPQATQTEVEQAYVNLLRPGNFSHFDTWREQLEKKYNQLDAFVAKQILTHLCQHADGCTLRQIHSALMTVLPGPEPDVFADRLARLLLDLVRDGYLLEVTGKYAFRSFPLREYWASNDDLTVVFKRRLEETRLPADLKEQILAKLPPVEERERLFRELQEKGGLSSEQFFASLGLAVGHGSICQGTG